MEKTTALRKVRVEGGNLRFSSAHFITFGGKCERLHGHNYGVVVELEGALGEDGLVFDFTILKHITRQICQHLNHRFLLPTLNPHLQIQEQATTWEILFGEKRYVFPREDVLPLPIDNSTAERLAEYICASVRKELAAYEIGHLQTMTVGVEEAPTQVAYYGVSLHDDMRPALS